MTETMIETTVTYSIVYKDKLYIVENVPPFRAWHKMSVQPRISSAGRDLCDPQDYQGPDPYCLLKSTLQEHII